MRERDSVDRETDGQLSSFANGFLIHFSQLAPKKKKESEEEEEDEQSKK